MFNRIAASWTLMLASWRILRSDRQLLVFPLASLIGTGIVIVTFAVPATLTGVLTDLGVNGQLHRPPMLLFTFCFYLVQYTVIIYCNSALMGAVLVRLDGGNPTLGDGFRIATEHIRAIIGFALLSATIGVILRSVAQRGILGQVAAALLGFTWSTATYFVIPVMVTQHVGPYEAIKQSAALLKRTWGEQTIGGIGVGIASMLLLVPACGIGVFAIALATASGAVELLVFSYSVLALALVIVGLVSTALQGIYTAALYRYATLGQANGGFDEDQLKRAFLSKPASSWPGRLMS